MLTFYPASLHQTFMSRLQSSLYGSTALPYPNAHFVRLFWNDVSFAALRADGDIVTWGWDEGSTWSHDTLQSMSTIRNSGTDATPSPNKPVGLNCGIYHIVPSSHSFVGLCLDGTVVYWGGVDSTSIAFQSQVMRLRNCTRVLYATEREVVVMHHDLTVSCVERTPQVSSPSCIAYADVQARLTDVHDVHYFSRAGGSFYVALTSQSVIAWGSIVGYTPDVSQKLINEVRGWSNSSNSTFALRGGDQTGQSSWLLQSNAGQTVIDEREYDRILGIHTTWTRDAPVMCASGVWTPTVAWCASNDAMHALVSDSGITTWGPVALRSTRSARFVRFRNPSATRTLQFGKWGLYATYSDAASDNGEDEAKCVLNALWPIHDMITYTANTTSGETTFAQLMTNPRWDAHPTFFSVKPFETITFDLQTAVWFSHIRIGGARPADVSITTSTDGAQFMSLVMVVNTSNPSEICAIQDESSTNQIDYINRQSQSSVCAVHTMTRGFAFIVRGPDVADDRRMYWVGNNAANVPIESPSFACAISEQTSGAISAVAASYGGGESLVVFQSPRRVVWLDQTSIDRTPNVRVEVDETWTSRILGQTRRLESDQNVVTAFTSRTDVAILTDATTWCYGLQGVSTTHDWSGVCIPRRGNVEVRDKWGNMRVISRHSPCSNFEGWDFSNVDLSDGMFRGSSFRHAQLHGAIWTRSDVQDVDFSYAI